MLAWGDEGSRGLPGEGDCLGALGSGPIFQAGAAGNSVAVLGVKVSAEALPSNPGCPASQAVLPSSWDLAASPLQIDHFPPLDVRVPSLPVSKNGPLGVE